MNQLTLIFTLMLVASHFLPGQSLAPENLNSPKAHVAFFDTISQMHQEYVGNIGTIIKDHGWESPEHLSFRNGMLKRNTYLRSLVDSYLDHYGFPTVDQETLKKRQTAQYEMIRQTQKVMHLDSIQRDSMIQIIAGSYGKDITLRDTWPTVMLILDTEPNFNKRCENITWLRFEWEEGNLSTQRMLVYLRHTYAAKHGKELDIATGSTERERILMHARELSGCWGN